ncbi:unnamed protein product [Aphis gossypii]|uniref:Uncharacterized protein n=1 Tax=Aphis gossypii TaxID=80765 RepID=A0A9P0NAJ6_APHGO|nr:unnamed protein product [Aphis gossypii]
MDNKKSSWVWQYTKKKEILHSAFYAMKMKITTLFAMEVSIGRHLMVIHSMSSNTKEKRRYLLITKIIERRT